MSTEKTIRMGRWTEPRKPREFRPAPGTQTPWGVADWATEIAPGIICYSTSSYGGVWVDDERLAQLHAFHGGSVKTFCGQPNWFEEDCDWAYVAIAFQEYFDEETIGEARMSLRYWKAHKAERDAAKVQTTNCQCPTCGEPSIGITDSNGLAALNCYRCTMAESAGGQ